ncbi:MAG: helix-turn-helix transcriptional regulator [Saprospiraceae bacterium]|nr:helix-turn-helix transcriptional regulator [Candidatus Brachybacter algidus]
MKELTNQLIHEFMDKEYAHAYMDSHQSTRLATQIKVLREQRGLTQKQLAELSKMKQERICALEDVDYDAWTISTLRKLAHAFDTTLHISFIPFSKGIQDIEDFSRENLQVQSRGTDLKHYKFINQDKEEWKKHVGMLICSHVVSKSVDSNINIESIPYKNNSEPSSNGNNFQNAA